MQRVSGHGRVLGPNSHLPWGTGRSSQDGPGVLPRRGRCSHGGIPARPAHGVAPVGGSSLVLEPHHRVPRVLGRCSHRQHQPHLSHGQRHGQRLPALAPRQGPGHHHGDPVPDPKRVRPQAGQRAAFHDARGLLEHVGSAAPRGTCCSMPELLHAELPTDRRVDRGIALPLSTFTGARASWTSACTRGPPVGQVPEPGSVRIRAAPSTACTMPP